MSPPPMPLLAGIPTVWTIGFIGRFVLAPERAFGTLSERLFEVQARLRRWVADASEADTQPLEAT